MGRYQLGTVAPSGNPVRSRTVEDAVHGVAQAFMAVGSPDPRLNSAGKIDFQLQRMLSGYKKQDPPPNQVKPIPVPILRQVMTTATNSCSGWLLAVADMICLAFFFHLRPGEYTGTKAESHPFTLQDIQLFQGPVRLNCATATDSVLLASTFGSLTFGDQKNGVRGEVIGLAHSGDLFFSPTISLTRRVIHLRSHNAPPTTPLASYFNPASGTFKPIKPSDITATLKAACTVLGPLYRFLHTDISGRSLRASGAMALLCAQVDSDIIQLIGTSSYAGAPMKCSATFTFKRSR
jgi:hypothetical protein